MQHCFDFYTPQNNISFPKDIRFHPSLNHGEKIFLAEVHSLAQKTKNKRMPYSSRKASDFFGVSHQTIINWVKHLIELELIEVGIDYNNQTQFIKTTLKQQKP